MLAALTVLLLFQLAGEVLAHLLSLPIPGPVIGMLLLFAALVIRGGPNHDLRETSGKLLQYLALLFVPAGAGIVLYGNRLADEWLSIGLALIGSTLLTIAVTALVLRALIRRNENAEPPQ